jgi:GNAT superfamily N-acetyltransferase
VIAVREATGADVPAIRELFRACYGDLYPDPHYYDEAALNRMVYADDTLLLVAEDVERRRLVGSASVLLEVGAYSDLIGEFGRLVVHPDAQHAGIGKLLMRERIARVEGRLHIGVLEARVTHPYSMKIAESAAFSPVGFMPLKMLLGRRESLALYVRYFDQALLLRKNHPRIVPEVHALADLALAHCALPSDAILDEESPPYPPGGDHDVEELTAEGYPALLRIERGRVRRREIFGPLRLHYGFFKLQASQSHYLIARDARRTVGAIGFTLDPAERAVRVFELIFADEPVVRLLVRELERRCRLEWRMSYLEVDVSADAPRMQRTFVELGWVPAAYVPAMVFHEVERIDVVKMVRLLQPASIDAVAVETLTPRARAVAEVVLRQLTSHGALPRIAQAVERLPLFADLSPEQIHRLARVCGFASFEAGEVMFREADIRPAMYLLLDGEVAISIAGRVVGLVRGGECVGEISLLTAGPHSATATARTRVEAAVLTRDDLTHLVDARPDIGLYIYRNLAAGLGEKLKRLDLEVLHPTT